MVNYRSSGKEAEALVSEIESHGVKAVAIRADIKSDDEVRRMVSRIKDDFGRLDVLVNNAGVTHWVKLANLEGLTDAIWDEILDVNVKGLISLCSGRGPNAVREPRDDYQYIVDLWRAGYFNDFFVGVWNR